MKVDFIIVGQGLAGTLLAYELLSLGKLVFVFDDPEQLKASDVAAGMINPIVFKRMTKGWLVDDVIPQTELTYRKLENLLQESFYFQTPIHRILNEIEASFWNEKRISNHLEEFIDSVPEPNFSHPKLIAPLGFGRVKKGGRLDVQKLLRAFSEYLEKRGMLRKEKFQTEKLNLNSGMAFYENLEAEKTIFCEGQGAAQNPFFKNLKFQSSKGEVLEVEIPSLNLNEIISREIFLMPIGNERYKVGATYQWDELNTETTGTARQELLNKLKSVIQAVPEIQDQNAGIRPTMHDRKPVIGLLPEFPEIGIFNGLGPKGVLLGPYFARQFAMFLTGQSTFIYPEVDIQRYFKKK